MGDGWQAEVRSAAASELRSFREEIKGRIDGLALAVSELSEATSLASPSELHKPSQAFGRTATKRLEALSATLSRSAGEPESEAGWRASIATEVAIHVAYLNGWVDGGGVFATLSEELEEGFDDPRKVTRCLRARMEFVTARVETSITKWLEPFGATGPKPGSVADRVGEILHIARFWDIELKVPAKPTKKWLAALEPKFEAAIQKRRAKRARLNKRKALLDFAEVMKITIKKVPDNPSDGYLAKLEQKLREIAGKKGVSVPELEGAPVAEPPPRGATMGDLLDPGLTEGPKTLMPGDDEDEESTADTRAIIEEMLEQAERADLKLGRIPHEPSAQWILKTKQMLEEATAKKRAQRKAERQSKLKARQERIERIRTQADRVGVDIGRIPPFPTDDWLGRIEMRIADRMLEVQKHKMPEDGARRAAVLDILARAERGGVDLGELPPDPDETWVSWAESKLADAESADEVFAVGEDPDEEEEVIPRVYFEKGTVQEESWPLDKDRVVIGRARDADIQIRHDGGISRRHCALVRDGDEWMLQDLGSARGTQLDGVPVSVPLVLYPGATIMVGESALEFQPGG